MAAERKRGPLRVVIADDDPAFAELLATIIDSHPAFEVVGIAKDGEEAVQLTVWQDADVVLMDIDMPKIDGLEATRLLRKSRPRAFVLLVSGVEDEREERGRKAGAFAYISKSKLDELDETLDALEELEGSGT